MRSRLILISILAIFTSITIQAEKYHAEVLLQKTNIEVKNNKITKKVSYQIKINNRAGDEYATISIPYDGLVKVSNIEGVITNIFGAEIRKLKKSDIKERSDISAISFYEDSYIKEFTLKHNTYPYIINYSYEVTESQFLDIVTWFPIIDTEIPTLKAELNVNIPQGYKITYRSNLKAEPELNVNLDEIKYHWETSYKEIIEDQYLAPDLFYYIPHVIIAPDKFKFEKEGNLSSWSDFGNWQASLLEDINTLTDKEKYFVTNLIKGIPNKKDIVKRLYHYLQDETRYINVGIETGGLQPYSAEYVCNNKYGDCKALSNYMKALLNYVGIDAYYTLVDAGEPTMPIDTSFVFPQFNHVILYIPLNHEDIWLDCTSSNAFNYLGTFTQNRKAFVTRKDSSYFKVTPTLKVNDVLETRSITIGYKNPEAEIQVNSIYRGDSYENINYLNKDYDERTKEKIVQKYLLDGGFVLKDFDIQLQNRDTTTIQMNYLLSSRNIYKHYGNDILINNIPFSIPELEKPEKRTLPVQIDYPVYYVDTLKYEVPDNYKIAHFSQSCSIKTKYGFYSFDVVQKESQIIIYKTFILNAATYQLSEYKAFYEFIHKARSYENKTHISLNKNS